MDFSYSEEQHSIREALTRTCSDFDADFWLKRDSERRVTHGGMGYAKEYHVERYLREAMLPRIVPVASQMILCFIAEKVLGLPKSY